MPLSVRHPRILGLVAALAVLAGLAGIASLALPEPTLKPHPEIGGGSGVPATIARKVARLEGEHRSRSDARPGLPFDQPDEARRHALLKRLGTLDPEHLAALDAPARYRRAEAARARLPVYATALGGPLSAKQRPGARSGVGSEPSNLAAAAQLAAWEDLGPGNVGGRTRALSIHPDRPMEMLAAGVSGGVFKTVDNGRNWIATGDQMLNIAVNSLARHPTNPDIVYAGTGEGYLREVIRRTGLPLRGGGIFESRDGGDSWTRLETTVTADFHWVNDLAVSRIDGRRLYAATRTGVWRSRDSGRSWQRALATTVDAGCLDLEARPGAAGDYLFVACGLFEQATVYRNPNAQADGPWEAVLSEPFQGRTRLAVAPSAPDVVYALAMSLEPGPNLHGLLGVYRSDSGGAAGSWQLVNSNTDSNRLDTLLLTNPVIAVLTECEFGTSQRSNLGWHTALLAVDPVDPDVVWAGAIDLFRSDDGGESWGVASYWWVDPNLPAFSHADHHEMVFHPDYDGALNRTALVINDGGVYRTDDTRVPVATDLTDLCGPGGSSTRWDRLNHGYGVTQFYHGAVLPEGGGYLGGTQDNGTILNFEERGPNGWFGILGGDGAYVGVDPRDGDVIYAEAQFGNFRKSINRGGSFQPARDGIAPDEDFLFVTPFVLDTNDPDRLWIGGRRLWRTDNGASRWQAASTTLGEDRQVSALAVAPGRSRRVLAGTHDGFIHRSDDALTAGGGTVWPAVQPRQGWVTWVTFDPRDPDVAWATYARFGGAHVWRSTDGGVTWEPRDGFGTGRLPDIPVHAVLVDPVVEGRVFLGTDLGVFVTTDDGLTWAAENTGFAHAVTESLALHENPNGTFQLYAFTHGRGAWRVGLRDPDSSDGLQARRLVGPASP